MALFLLSWLFRVSGQAPKNRILDRYLAVVPFTAIILLTFDSLLTTDYRRFALAPSRLVMSLFSGVMANLSPILKANLSVTSFWDLYYGLDSLKYCEKDKTVPKYILLFYLCFLLLRLIYSYAGGDSLFFTLKKVLAYNCIMVPLLQLILLVKKVHGRFSLINKQLELVLKNCDSNCKAYLKDLFRDHILLRQFTVDISYYFSMYVFALISTRFIVSFSMAYGILIQITNNRPVRFNYELIFQFFYMSLIAIVSVICQHCTNQGKETALIVLKTVDHNTPIQIMDSINNFLLSFYNSPMSFSVWELLYLGTKFLTKITALLLTYLTIAVQLNKSK